MFTVCLQFVDQRHTQARVSQNPFFFFLALWAKWNIVCLGLQPSLPLGIWPRWTVIKQGCAESAPHIYTASTFTIFLFMLLPGGFFFFSLSGDQSHMPVFVPLVTHGRSCFRARVFKLWRQALLAGWGRVKEKTAATEEEKLFGYLTESAFRNDLKATNP